jgi:hypothetical protein
MAEGIKWHERSLMSRARASVYVHTFATSPLLSPYSWHSRFLILNFSEMMIMNATNRATPAYLRIRRLLRNSGTAVNSTTTSGPGGRYHLLCGFSVQIFRSAPSIGIRSNMIGIRANMISQFVAGISSVFRVIKFRVIKFRVIL